MVVIVCLIILAFILLFMEIFVPGGLLGFLAVCCILGAGYTAFLEYGVAIATAVTLGAALVAVVMFFIEIRILKAGGRHLSVEQKIEARSVDRPQNELVGKHGETISSLKPGGKVLIAGKAYEAHSQSGLLQKGAEIEVVRVEDLRIIVRKT